MLSIFPPPGLPGGADEAPRMGTVMYQSDLDTLVAAHKRSPQRVPAYAVALGLLMYRGQKEYPATPKAFAKMLGITYDVACRTLKDARQFLAEQPTTSVGCESDETDHLGRCEPTTSVGSYRPPRSVPPHPPIEDKREFKEILSTHTALACEDAPDPSAKSDFETIRRVMSELEESGIGSQWIVTANRLADHWNAEWVAEVVKDQAAKHPRGKSAEYCRPILLEWLHQGGPPSLRPRIALRPTGTAGRPDTLADDLASLVHEWKESSK